LAEDSSGLGTGGLLALGPFARTSPLSLTLGLNLLKANGAAETLARPRVTTLDGVQAQLNATQSFPVVVSSSDGQESVQNITTGIQLTFLPKISPNGMIEAELSISVSTPTGITSQKVPTFSSREASTTVRVANGEQIVIGGLYEKRELKEEQKVPILGDIPILGALFTSTSIEERETDLVIVVTPRIVETEGLPTIETDK
jgi:type II secretory pathway component GspD/PulD (secretin)